MTRDEAEKMVDALIEYAEQASSGWSVACADPAEKEIALRNDARAALIAALTAGPGVPEGFVMVPIRPTNAMWDAWRKHQYNGPLDKWEAMLAAAPPDPVAGVLAGWQGWYANEALAIIKGFLACPEIADCGADSKEAATETLESRARQFLAHTPAPAVTTRDVTTAAPDHIPDTGKMVADAVAAEVSNKEALDFLSDYDQTLAKRIEETGCADGAAQEVLQRFIRAREQGGVT